MKANEYIKKYGVDCAKEILAHNQDLMNIGFFIDLKRLVESHELVESCGGINGARKELANFCGNLIDCVYLGHAIADVESCMEVSCESNWVVIMKANEFVKKFGLVKSRGIVGLMTAGVVNYDGDSVDYNDLKRLVESHELVEMVISRHNKSFKECQIDIHGLKSFVKKNPKIYSKRLKRAIADVESCMEVSRESN